MVDRFGPAFFRHLPKVPGVYWFASADGRLLYVGKARDLRKRLGSYRRLEGQPSKTVRMVQQTSFIRWESCVTEAEALQREAELIRTYQPPFNRIGKWSGGRKWIWILPSADQIEFRLAEDPPANGGSDLLSGQPFPHSAGRLFSTLLRLLWWATEPGRPVLALPRPLLQSPGPKQWVLPTTQSAEWVPALQLFLQGDAVPLMEQISAPRSAAASPFESALWSADLERLRDALVPELQLEEECP